MTPSIDANSASPNVEARSGANLEAVSAAKTAARTELSALRPSLVELADSLAQNPELGFEEHRSAQMVRALLEDFGFVGSAIDGLPTAFRMEAGTGPLTIAMLCEYDALPELGHACGHNLIAAIGVGAGVALRRALDASDTPLTSEDTTPQESRQATSGTASGTLGDARVVVIGTPAEEGGGGKIHLLDAGIFDDVDLALMAHPAGMDLLTMPSLAVAILEIDTFGRAAHAAAQPQAGINALDALIGGFQAVAMLRQHVPDGVRLHGIITNGGTAANVVPDHCSARFMVRTPHMTELAGLVEKVENCFRCAARAVGANAEIRIDGKPYAEIRRWGQLETWYRSNMRELGRQLTPIADVAGVMVGSTDMGNVTQVIPGLHPMIGIGNPSLNIHTAAFAEQTQTEAAYDAIIDAASALAMTAIDFLADPGAAGHQTTTSSSGKE